METDTAFIRTDRIIELYTITEVGLHLAFVVHPRYAESEDTVRLDDTFNDFGLLKFGMLVVNLFDRFEDFAYCLQVFALTRVAKFQVRHQFLNIHD